MEQHQHYQSLQDQAYNALRSKIGLLPSSGPARAFRRLVWKRRRESGARPFASPLCACASKSWWKRVPRAAPTSLSNQHGTRRECLFLARETRKKRTHRMPVAAASLSEQKHRLEQILAESESLDHSETRRFFDLDNLFHETCFEIAGRHMLWDWMKSVNTHFERYNWLRMVSQDLDSETDSSAASLDSRPH